MARRTRAGPDVERRLRKAGVEYVRILWCDNANVIRGKAAHLGLLVDGLPDGVGITVAQQALPVMYDAVVPDSGLSPVGEARLLPDWSTLAVLPWAPTHAQVIGDMWRGGRPWAHCPRDFLRAQIRRLEARGLTARAAFENEFFLMRRAGDRYEAADTTVYAATGSMNAHHDFVRDLTRALLAQGLEPEFYYPESAPGQQELSIRHAAALAAADRQIAYREAVRGVAQQHGLVACFLAKAYERAAGSGCHLNVSLWRGARPVTADASDPAGLSSLARDFMAGVLAHLRGLSALTAASANSYRRLRPHGWAGAYRTWGRDNREAAIRVVAAPARAARLELKTSDATANPYLALGALLAAGLDGLERRVALPPETAVDPGDLSEAEREAVGIDLLPQTLAEALDALAKDEALLAALGPERARAYLAVKRAEWEALKDLSLEQEVTLLAERY
ncbi:MAG: glutamine synthetase family protein [Candidatus Rokubacteria bacterium]|nr:glutamine synthetase family protein [Candidatus Rokubacteria bacterium]